MIDSTGIALVGKANAQGLSSPGVRRSDNQPPKFLPITDTEPRTSAPSLKEFTKKIMTGVQLTAREMLLYQIRVGEFNLRVELLSKCAEACNASLRKLQQGQ